jgi:hypothetical protein
MYLPIIRALGLAAVLVLAGLWIRASVAQEPKDGPKASPFLASPEYGFYYTRTNCCGLVAAYMVVNDLGKPIDLRTVASDLPVTSTGTSMEALATYFKNQNLGTAAIEADTTDLYAILECNPPLNSRLRLLHHRTRDWSLLSFGERRTALSPTMCRCPEIWRQALLKQAWNLRRQKARPKWRFRGKRWGTFTYCPAC